MSCVFVTHMNESCHTHTAHVRMKSHISMMLISNAITILTAQVYMHTPHIRMSHVMCSCHTYECVMLHIYGTRTNEVTRINDANQQSNHISWLSRYTCKRHIYDWVMSRRFVTHMNESCHTCTSHIRMKSHVSMMLISNAIATDHVYMYTPHARMSYIMYICHTYAWVMSHIYVRRVNESSHTHKWC